MKEMMKNYWSEFKTGIKTMFKEFFNKETNKKQRANMWTFARLTSSFLIPICSLISILTSSLPLFIASIGITGFGAITDFFDGRSARKYNSSSEFGKNLDQISDKVFSLMIGITLSLFNPLFTVILAGEGLIATINTAYKLQYNDLNIKSTQIGRIKQWPLSFSLILGFISTLVPNLALVTNISILLTSMFQIATMGSYIHENNEKIKVLEQNKDNNNEFDLLKNEESKFDKEKNKSLENKDNYIISKNITIVENNMSRTERIQILRNWSNEIAMTKTINNDQDKVSSEEKGYQKIKNDCN